MLKVFRQYSVPQLYFELVVIFRELTQERSMRHIFSTLLAVFVLWSTNVLALSFPMPAPGDDIVGEIQTVVSAPGETLTSIGQRYDIGGYEMRQANPDLRRQKLKPGTQVTLPSQFILPTSRNGLVVNLAEMRVYYFPENENMVYTFPIGVGKEGWNTPRRSGTVVRKQEGPTWTPPPSIRAESARMGKILPHSYPPGPKNPLGKYAIYLSIPGIRFHGTNAPNSVGTRASHGCMRMLAPDIEYLFNNVPIGTPIKIIYQQDKIGWLQGRLYLESEVPFKEFDNDADLDARITAAADSRVTTVNWDQVNEITGQRYGIPTPIN
jgi:L,D-transpeptidase ErfK/SrfK